MTPPLPSGDLAFSGTISTAHMTGEATDNVKTGLNALEGCYPWRQVKTFGNRSRRGKLPGPR